MTRRGAHVRPRLVAAGAAAVVLVAGLAVRAGSDGAFAKYAGVALYAAFVHTVVVWLFPRWSPFRAGGVALALCWAVELAQLTPGPAALSERSTLARLALGSTFHPPDLVWYAVGAASAAAVHRLGLAAVDSRTSGRHNPSRSARSGTETGGRPLP